MLAPWAGSRGRESMSQRRMASRSSGAAAGCDSGRWCWIVDWMAGSSRKAGSEGRCGWGCVGSGAAESETAAGGSGADGTETDSHRDI